MSCSRTCALKNSSGRNFTGAITCRHKGGRHKRALRYIDFNRYKNGEETEISAQNVKGTSERVVAIVDYVFVCLCVCALCVCVRYVLENFRLLIIITLILNPIRLSRGATNRNSQKMKRKRTDTLRSGKKKTENSSIETETVENAFEKGVQGLDRTGKGRFIGRRR